jgi:hypothetical protein
MVVAVALTLTTVFNQDAVATHLHEARFTLRRIVAHQYLATGDPTVTEQIRKGWYLDETSIDVEDTTWKVWTLSPKERGTTAVAFALQLPLVTAPPPETPTP